MTQAYEVFWNDFEQAPAVAWPTPAPNQSRYVEALSQRERQVLTRLAQGNTLQVAAAHLGISRNTVHTHVKHIYEKLGVSSRSEAALAAVRLRLHQL